MEAGETPPTSFSSLLRLRLSVRPRRQPEGWAAPESGAGEGPAAVQWLSLSPVGVGAPEKSPTDKAGEDWLGETREPLWAPRAPGIPSTGTWGGGRS